MVAVPILASIPASAGNVRALASQLPLPEEFTQGWSGQVLVAMRKRLWAPTGCSIAAAFTATLAATASRGRRRCALHAVKPEAKQAFDDMIELNKDLRAIKKTILPRGSTRVGNMIWFEVTLDSPLGMKLDDNPEKGVVGVTDVLDEGGAAEHNRINMLEEDILKREMWIQRGDQIIMVNGISVTSLEQVVELIQDGQQKGINTVRMKFSRQRTGFVQVVLPDLNWKMAVPQSAKLPSIANAAGLPFSCEENKCDGSCWHMNERSGEIYPMCLPCKVGSLPSKSCTAGNPFVARNDPNEEDFDNVEPLVLTPCPELFGKTRDELIEIRELLNTSSPEELAREYQGLLKGPWRYGNGYEKSFVLSKGGELECRFEERMDGKRYGATLSLEGRWMQGEVKRDDGVVVGEIRVRPELGNCVATRFRSSGEEKWSDEQIAINEKAMEQRREDMPWLDFKSAE